MKNIYILLITILFGVTSCGTERLPDESTMINNTDSIGTGMANHLKAITTLSITEETLNSIIADLEQILREQLASELADEELMNSLVLKIEELEEAIDRMVADTIESNTVGIIYPCGDTLDTEGSIVLDLGDGTLVGAVRTGKWSDIIVLSEGTYKAPDGCEYEVIDDGIQEVLWEHLVRNV